MPESLLIGLTALQTHKRAMEVTSHNLANATTAGFSRQRTDLTAPVPEDISPGQVGRGVDVAAIKRIVDTLTNDRLRASETETSRLSSLSSNLKTIEAAFNEPGENGFSGITNSLFNVLSDLSNNPESAALRSAAVQEMQTWSSTLNDLSSRLDQLSQDMDDSISEQVDSINSLTSQISLLNQQVRRQTVAGNDPNDLLDERDRLVTELSGYLELQVRSNANDGSIMIDAGGVTLVGGDSANTLQVSLTADGIHIQTPNSGILRPQGGSLAALDELGTDIIPGLVDAMDNIAATVAKRLNELHATGTSQSMSATSFQAAFTVPSSALTTNLDDASVAQTGGAGAGIPATFLPSFTDAAGNPTARNLTINIRDTATGEARKYTVRYDPAQGTGTRSLQDLVQAINTGSGGGFAVLSDDTIGIAGLSAKAVAVADGWQFQLATATGYSVDFSQALDQKPGSSQWSGPQVTVDSSTAIPASVGSQLQFAVEKDASSNLQLRISTRNASDGSVITHGLISLSGTPPFSIPGIGGTGTIDINYGAGTFRAGDSFVVDLDAGGNVLQKGSTVAGTYTQDNERVSTDAAFSVTGRYSGSLGLEPNAGGSPPYTTWSMQVITGGTIGATASSDVSKPQPPVVEFSYWTGSSGAPTRQSVRMTLDQKLPAGTPVQIAEGVYAVFSAGTLTATDPGENATFTVDAQPDQAGLLAALGINTMFTGSTAANLKVAQRLIDDPTQLNVGTTRSEGDNSNVLRFIAARSEKLFSGGTVALDDSYNAVLSTVGVKINQASRLSENQSTIQSALQKQRDQVSGVNIDEEVGQLILQQQAYAAAARVISFARENIQTLLDLAR